MNPRHYLERLNTLSTRELAMVSVALAAVLGTALQFLLLDPLLDRSENAVHNLAALERAGAALEQQLKGAEQNSAEKRHEELLAARRSMEASVRAVDLAIEEFAATLVAPDVMPVVLRRVLADLKLDLLELSNDAPVALLQIADDPVEGTGGVRNLYRHGLTLRLSGSFADAVRYLQGVESLPWRFMWEEMNYEVLSYPKAVIEVRLQTLSTVPGWFGV